MKKTILLCALTLITAMSFAHDIELGCWRDGRFSQVLTNVALGTTVHVTTDNGFDSTFVYTSDPTSFTVPQPNINVAVHVHMVFIEDAFVKDFVTNVGLTNTCSALPLKISSFKVKKIDDNTARVYLTIYDVINVKYVNINMSVDGKSYKVVGKITPDNVSDTKQYYLDVKLRK